MEQINQIVNDMDFMTISSDCYKINKQGDIWSIKQKKIMKPSINEDGYLKTSIYIENKRHKRYIHRLLAIQYIPNPDNLPEVDHIDRNRINNDLSNLRWVNKTQQNNNKSTTLTIEQKIISKENNIKYKAEWAKNKKINMTEEEKEIYNEKVRIYQQKKRAEMTPEQKEKEKQRRIEYNKKIKNLS